MDRKMDRRAFLSTMALAGGTAALVGLSGCSTKSSPAKNETTDNKDAKPSEMSADIVVVGAGGAGLCAALTAEAENAKVILLESMPVTGGATLGSTSSNICGSKMQKDSGVEDTPETIFASYEKDIRDPNILEVARTWSENNGATHDWLQNEIGVEFNLDTLAIYPPYTIERCCYATGGGVGIVAALTDKVNESSIEMLLETTVTSLIKDNGKVVGVTASDAKGNDITINAKAVILAAGGFAANKDMIPFHLVSDAVYYGWPSSDGKWVPVSADAGTKFLDMGCVPMENGGLETSPGFGRQLFSPVMQAFVRGSGLIVNPAGARIAKEVGSTNSQWIEAYRTCPDSAPFLFMDKATFDIFYQTGVKEIGGAFTAEEFDNWLKGDSSDGLPLIVQGDTVKEVAEKAGIDAAGLQATIDAFNADAAAGKPVDSAFKRPIKAPVGEGPYCVVRQSLRYAHSLGGLVANGKLEVLDWTETPIAGLYAAGQIIRSIQGDVTKPSTSTAFAYTSGQVAARNALAAI